MRPPHRVVILGGGFAGVRVARRLARHEGRRHLAVTLVNRGASHAYTPALYALAGAASETRRREELERSSALPLRRLLAGLPASVIEGEAVSVDTQKKEVVLGDGRALSYDTVVFALGSEPALYGIPGLAEHAIALKSIHDAEAVSRKVGLLMRGRAEPLRVLVGGAGATGVELSAMLAERIGRHQAGTHVTLLEAQDGVLPGFPPEVRAYVAEQLARRGVAVRPNACVTKAEAKGVTVEGEEVIPFDLLVWTGGIQAPALLATLPYVLDRGRLVADAPLTCVPRTGETERRAYALGDAACFHYGERVAPWTASVALAQADVVADNVLRALAGRKPRRFRLRGTSYVIPLGTTGGVARVMGIPFRGRVVQLLTLLAEAHYLASVLPLASAGRLILKRLRA